MGMGDLHMHILERERDKKDIKLDKKQLNKISSVESQKGANAAQGCFVENQKGAIAVQSLWQ